MWQKIISHKYAPVAFFAGIFLVGFLGGYFGVKLIKGPKTISADISTPTPFVEPEQVFTPVSVSDSYNVVLLGSGGAGHSGGNLTDSIIVVSINPKEKHATFVSVPRDLWVPGNYKINAALTNTGLGGVKGVIQNVTGLKIEKYASIDFSGLIKLIDNLGGVSIEIPNTFDDYFYPVKGLENETCGKTPEEIALYHQKYSGFELEKQFTCRYEHIHFEKGTAKIDGATALKLARSRHGDSDFGRSARQFAILKGIFNALWQRGGARNIDEIYTLAVKTLQTDVSLKEAKSLLEVLGKPDEYSITQVQLTEGNVLSASKSRDGQYILIPKSGVNNFSGIKSFISKNNND